MQLQFICPDCHCSWITEIADELIIQIPPYADICPNCGSQNDPIDILELADQTGTNHGLRGL